MNMIGNTVNYMRIKLLKPQTLYGQCKRSLYEILCQLQKKYYHENLFVGHELVISLVKMNPKIN